MDEISEISVDLYMDMTISKAPAIFNLQCMLEEEEIPYIDFSGINKSENGITEGELILGWRIGEGENEIPYAASQSFAIYKKIDVNGYEVNATSIGPLRFTYYPSSSLGLYVAEYPTDIILSMMHHGYVLKHYPTY